VPYGIKIRAKSKLPVLKLTAMFLNNTWPGMFDSEHPLYLNNTGFGGHVNFIKNYKTKR